MIVFRVDSSYQIGSGHIMRTLALAEALKEKGFKITYICRKLPGNMIDYIKNKGYVVKTLPYNPKEEILSNRDKYLQWMGEYPETDAKQTIKEIKEEKIDCFVVDHYAIDYKWERKLRNYTKKIMVIDDLANRVHDCDILLDQNLYEDMGTRYDDLVPEHCTKLLGPQYALLRKEFIEARKKMKQRDGKVKRILVFFGGSDPTNETMKAIKAIIKLKRTDIIIDIVVGRSNRNKNIINDLCKKNNFNYYCQINNISELMLKADLFIGSGGSITWERSFLGLPGIVISVEDNQEKILENISKKEASIYMGRNYEVTCEDIFNSLVKIINNNIIIEMSQKSISIFKKFDKDKVVGLLIKDI